MKYQTFTKKEEEVKLSELEKRINRVYEKYGGEIKGFYEPKLREGKKSGFIDFPNRGGVHFLARWHSLIDYEGIACQACSNYLGFRETKKFNKMLSDIENSLEEICYVHTGEIK